jgi:hypothetical protein
MFFGHHNGPFAMLLHQFLSPLLVLAFAAGPASAAGTVQLELVGTERGSALLFQEWAKTLSKAGIENVRFRVGEDSDKPGIETRGTAENPTYLVTGIVRSRNELALPGGRFGPGDAGRLKQWLQELAERGPNAEKAAGKGETAPFGLSAAQFERIRDDLATPVGFATRGQSGRQIVEKITERLKWPLKLDGEAAQALADQKLDESLDGLSCGTALSYALRSAGYGLLPRVTGGQPGYAVVEVRGKIEVWPVGWPEKPSGDKGLPGLFEFLNVNVQNVSAARALEAIAKRLKMPVLFDHRALARHGIDPAKTMVSLPRGRTTYSLALRKLLGKAGMKFDVRYDEAGTPLLWVTSLKPR